MDNITPSASAEIFIFSQTRVANDEPQPLPRRGAPRKVQPSEQAEAAQEIRRKHWNSYYYRGDAITIWAKMVTNNAKKRARVGNVHFDLTCTQIRNLLPLDMRCPVLGIPLTIERGHKGMTPTSATVDRIDPGGAYTFNNCHIISNIANRGKCQMTLRQLADAGKWASKTIKNLGRRKIKL